MKSKLLLSTVLALLLIGPVVAPAADSLVKTLVAVQQELGKEGIESAIKVLQDAVCGSREIIAANAAADEIQLAWGLGQAWAALREHSLVRANSVARIMAGCAAESRADVVQGATASSSTTARRDGPQQSR